ERLALGPNEPRAAGRYGPKADGPVKALVLDCVRFGYPEGQAVLHGVSLDVASGEHVVLVGRTGAGKSAVLQLATGLYRPWSGRITVAGGGPPSLGGRERPPGPGVLP